MTGAAPSNADRSLHSGVPKTLHRPGARILVLGIGNVLMGDDGVGIHAVRELRKCPRAGVLVTEVGNALLDAVPLLTWAERVLVIDALMAHGPPGTIYFAPFGSIASQQRTDSLHELDIGTALSFMPVGCMRPEVFILGIEPASLDWCLNLSPEVLHALPCVVRIANEQLLQWRMALRCCREHGDK